MESYRLIRRLFAATLLATAGSLVAAEAPSASAAKEAAKTGAADARKNAQEQINAERAKMIADHEALAKQYAAANEEQKKEILAKMAERKKEFENAMSALVKQMREDERRSRASKAAAAKR